MKRYCLELTLTGPVMMPGTENVTHGVDASFQRNWEGKFIIPGTQVKGVVRHALSAMATAIGKSKNPQSIIDRSWIDRFFGKASSASAEEYEEPGTTGWEPQRSRVLFSDLVLKDAKDHSQLMTRIGINNYTGTVKHGHIQILEQPLDIGEVGIFEGYITIRSEDEDAEEIRKWINKALAFVPAIGSGKSSGFGRVKGYKINEINEKKDEQEINEDLIHKIIAAGAADVTLKFDGPFLVACNTWNSNDFSGSENIPGSVLKAVIGEETGAYKTDDKLHDSLSRCVISQLSPLTEKGEPSPTIKHSDYCIKIDDGIIFLDALHDAVEEDAKCGLLSFQIDWKEEIWDKHPQKLEAGKTNILHSSRTRTAINSDEVADEGLLFSYSSIIPGEQVWKGCISKGSLTDAEFSALIKAIPEYLQGFGKTSTGAKITLAPKERHIPQPSGIITLMLETDACLHAPDDLFSFDMVNDDAEQLRLQYQAYFANALRERQTFEEIQFDNTDLSLQFYARQYRIGGYLAGRYPPSATGYYPWILTKAGAVFQFTVPKGYEEAARSFFQRGLPVPSSFDEHRKTWRGNPFVPENGFGEVTFIDPMKGSVS